VASFLKRITDRRSWRWRWPRRARTRGSMLRSRPPSRSRRSTNRRPCRGRSPTGSAPSRRSLR